MNAEGRWPATIASPASHALASRLALVPMEHCPDLFAPCHRLHGDRVWCPGCGRWAAIVMRVDNSVYLAPAAPPEYPRPAPREE
jgi:hypothetical protein